MVDDTPDVPFFTPCGDVEFATKHAEIGGATQTIRLTLVDAVRLMAAHTRV